VPFAIYSSREEASAVFIYKTTIVVTFFINYLLWYCATTLFPFRWACTRISLIQLQCHEKVKLLYFTVRLCWLHLYQTCRIWLTALVFAYVFHASGCPSRSVAKVMMDCRTSDAVHRCLHSKGSNLHIHNFIGLQL